MGVLSNSLGAQIKQKAGGGGKHIVHESLILLEPVEVFFCFCFLGFFFYVFVFCLFVCFAASIT